MFLCRIGLLECASRWDGVSVDGIPLPAALEISLATFIYLDQLDILSRFSFIRRNPRLSVLLVCTRRRKRVEKYSNRMGKNARKPQGTRTHTEVCGRRVYTKKLWHFGGHAGRVRQQYEANEWW